MSIFSMGARLISKSSPALLAASGAALILTMPAFRRGLRTALVAATKGALIVSDGVSNFTEKIKSETTDIVEEARQTKCPCPAAKFSAVRSAAKAKGRSVAVAATAGVLGVKEKVKSAQNDFKDIVEEAQKLREEKVSDLDIPTETNVLKADTHIELDGLEASTVDIGTDEVTKRRPGRKKSAE